VKIREVAAATTGDQNLLANPICMIENNHAMPALSGHDRRHESCRPSTED
jgi:hypothetical protein